MKTTLLAAVVFAASSIHPAFAQQPKPLPTNTPYRQTAEAPHLALPIKHVSPPQVLHWCSQHCSTWVWAANRYVGEGTPHPETNLECGVTVERFDTQAVIMHRTDCGQFPGKATLTGKLSDDGESIVDGKIQWTWHPCCGLATASFVAAWGEKIAKVPANDRERDALMRASAPSTSAQAQQNQSAATFLFLGLLVSALSSNSQNASVPDNPWDGPESAHMDQVSRQINTFACGNENVSAAVCENDRKLREERQQQQENPPY